MAPHLRRLGAISFAVFDAGSGKPVTHFDYAVEVIRAAPVRGSAAGSHRASAPAPLDMPFNLRIEAKGHEMFRLRQVLVRSGQPEREHTIHLHRVR